jgi:Na+-driven multidrug efflux pump
MFTHLTKEFSYNWKLAYPVIMGMLGHTFVGLVDNIMVGQLGSAELAAVSLGNSFLFIAMSLGIGFSTAITPLVAEADSENDFKKRKVSVQAWLVLVHRLKSFVIYFDFISQAANVFHETTPRGRGSCNALFEYCGDITNPTYYFSRI